MTAPGADFAWKSGSRMSATKKLALIALGYALAIAGGFAAVAVNELLMPADVSQGSPGMVAFGDMILFVLATCVLALVPTWFLLRLAMAKWPRALLAVLLLVVVMGPLSWISMVDVATMERPGGAHANGPAWLGLWIAFVAIPRIVAGPVLVLGEGAALLVSKDQRTRRLLGLAMTMDLVPLALFAWHLVSVSV
jgi:hypothetical protein